MHISSRWPGPTRLLSDAPDVWEPGPVGAGGGWWGRLRHGVSVDRRMFCRILDDNGL